MVQLSTTAKPDVARAAIDRGFGIPLWAAVVVSRLIVLAAGAVGALFAHPLLGWQIYDPTRISSSLGSVGNVIAASAVRWDAIGYITVAQHGYTTAGSTRWFPLYPMLIHVIALLVVSPVIAGMLISVASFAIGLTLVHRIANEEVGPRVADACILLIAFGPWSFVFTAIYTESLMFALAAGTFYLARRGRFILACIAAACAALAHIQGILLVAPLAFIYWNSRGRSFNPRQLLSPNLAGLALPPLALAAFFFYMHTHGWGWLAPITSQNQANAGRTLVGPVIVVFDSVKDVVTSFGFTHSGVIPRSGSPFDPGVQNTIYLGILTLTILALVSAWRRLPKEYALFAGLALLVCTSSAVAMIPLQGFPRYMLPVFPLWIGAATWFTERRLTLLLALATLSVWLMFYTVEFTRWASVF